MTRHVLGLDTSTLSISLALVRLHPDGGWEVVASRDRGAEGPNHSTLLPGWIEEVLKEGGLELRGLDGISVGLGPGGFTGLRIALATAKGIAYAARVPLVGVSTLEAMALRAAPRVPEARSIVAMLDARKQEVYAGFFRRAAVAGAEVGASTRDDAAAGGGSAPAVAPLFAEHEVVSKPAVIAERLRTLEGPLALLGEGYLAYREIFDEATDGLRISPAEALPWTPNAVEIARLGAPLLGPYSKEAVFALEPRYIRPSDAEFTVPSSRGKV